MLNVSTPNSSPALHAQSLVSWQQHGSAAMKADMPDCAVATRRIFDNLQRLQQLLQPQRRIVHAGDHIHQAGESFRDLYILNSGLAKTVSLSADGREQVVGLKFRGDWLGFDGIAHGQYQCDAISMDTGEVWSFGYEATMAACTSDLALLDMLHQAMSSDICRDRDSLMSVCTLPADARVADFLRYWATSLARRGQRLDHISMPMTRAEIGNYLGVTLETVSRALSRLAREGVIVFIEKHRREFAIPDLSALSSFVQRCLEPAARLQ
jgi:CRP/FNR family transcriptional regulator, anaerobic regulatory protein